MRLFIAVTMVVFLPLRTAATTVIPIPELVCQQSAGNESLRFVKRVHLAERRCADAVAAGALCDEARRDADVARAAAQLAKLVASRCGDVVLEHLGFPALCTDPGGAPFVAAELASCLEDSHQTRVAAAIARAYPGAPAPLAGAALRCQRTIGGAAEKSLGQRLRARESCRNDQLSGAIDQAIACGGEAGATGHTATDRRLVTAATRPIEQVARKCTGVVLEDLGFPGACGDLDGPPFTLADLQNCIAGGVAVAADEMFAFEYP